MFRSLNRLDPKFLPSRPPDDCFRYFYPLLILECDSERESFPRSHGQIIGETPPIHERFQTVPWPWNGPEWYVTEHGTGKRRKGRSTKGIGASQGSPF
jgi:hypothetical protein